MISKIIKRNGEIVDFKPEKISNAITKAVQAVGGHDLETPKKLTEIVVKQIEKVFGGSGRLPDVESVQDVVEKVLIEEGHAKTAKAYILYREKRNERRYDKSVTVSVEKTISEYLNREDWRVNANANQGYSLGGMILNTSGKVTANYWLSHVYPEDVANAHRNADYHIHDLDMFSGYCAGWSLRALLEEGLNGVPSKTESAPPKHLSSAINQMVNFFGTLQNEWAGAQAFSSFDTYLSPFVKKFEMELEDEINNSGVYNFPSEEAKQKFIDEKTYKFVKQNIQSFVFNLNIPSRWGTQTPFTNITLDLVCPEDLKKQSLKMGGKYFPYAFGQLQKEMDMINKAYVEVMTAGDAKGRVFTFPIPTYNITKDFDWDNPNHEPIFEMTAKYGMPYFQNFINSDMKPNQIRSMCCRLQLDLRELLKRGNGLFGSAEMTGSIGVVTINSARIGYTGKGDKQKFLERLEHLMYLAKTSLEIKRKEVAKWLERGLFPYSKRYLPGLNNHFSTIGINGLNEAILNFTGGKENITTEWGSKFAEETLIFMREKLKAYQEETGNLYNLEASPAEGATHRFAKEDQRIFPGIIQAGTPEAPYYTNSSQIPVEYTDDAFEALELQDKLQTKYTGGTVLHLYMNERMCDASSCRKLVKTVLSKYRLPYITITPTFSICPKHGYLKGEHHFCPACDQEIGYAGSNIDENEIKKHRSKKLSADSLGDLARGSAPAVLEEEKA
ncbi:MAG: ribonucleoside triphosphate reductase [Candidatus Pacebacteria bacterium]|nr:ribonucleoside triphosphate reductase [Candidatus Paceibacterota bacterium]NUQ57165.1 ribonucleoside triphosphate reductase [Candidatus Paceibacter sp.]